MDLMNIEKTLKNRKIKPLGKFKKYAVLLPLIYINGEIHLLYEVRAFHMDTQPGEISFPGGMVEDGETYREAAIRETCEELNITSNKLKIIGELDCMISPFNFIIKPFVAVLDNIEFDFIEFNRHEVDEIFTVPLSFLLNSKPLLHHILIEPVIKDDFPFYKIQKGKNYNWRKGKYPVYFYEYNDYIIWGITARFTKNFIDIIQ